MSAPADQNQEWQHAFGRRVRELREAAGLTQMGLAEVAGMHTTYLSSIERGRRNVSLINIHRLAQALSVRAGRLLD